jgi:hypothetical protein
VTMKSKLKYTIPLVLLVVLTALAAPGYAQGQETITAQVDRTSLSTDETLNLVVTLNASAMSTPTPSLPSLQGFSVVGSSTSSQLSIVNGAMSSQVVYTYRLRPTQTGDLVIDPVSVTVNGLTLSTGPVTVHVTQGTGAAPSAPSASPVQQGPPPGEPAPPAEGLAGQDVFVEAVVDNPTPFVGQQVVYSFRLYQASSSWGQPQYHAPTFTGFWSEHESSQYEYRVQAAGRIYEVTEVQTILFPTAAGPVTIDSARLTTAGSFFRSGRTLQTKPVALDVKPLPPNAPADFGGAVGQFSMEASVEPADGKVNEPLTWHVTLNGVGNVTTAPDPVWPEIPGWRSFESNATVNTEVRDGKAVGSRVYERLLVPSRDGEFTLPSLEYAYFDPALGEYQNLRTDPVPVSVAPGDPETPVTQRLQSAEKETIVQTATDIRHLKPVPSELTVAAEPLTESTLYWVAWAFPLFGAAGYLAWQRRQQYWERNGGLARSAQARKRAKRAISQARKEKGDAYGAVGQILTTYLADKLDRPLAGLTHQALDEVLAGKGIEPDLVERVEVCLVSSELGRFAPGADNPDHAKSLLREADILIDALEKAL